MAKRGRPRKQRDVEDAIDDSIAEDARKNSELTEDERHALHLRHCREYEVALEAKKKADAGIKNVGKRIKAEDDSIARVKKTIRARTPEGEAELRAEIEETAEVLRWSGVSVGESADLFPEDRTPGVDRAYAEGKRAGMNGDKGQPPHDPSVPQYQSWMRGWQDGQGILSEAFKKIPDPEPEMEQVSPTVRSDLSDPPFSPPPDAPSASPAA